MTQAPGRFWIIRHPTGGGDIIGRFDTAGETQIPDAVANYTDFKLIEMSDRAALVDNSIDQTGLTETENGLLSKVYPVER